MTGSQPKGPPGAVSKRMLVVVVLMLVVIVVPTVIVGMPTSKLVVTLSNVSPQGGVNLSFSIRGVENEFRSFYLMPDEVKTLEFSVTIGEYRIEVECWGSNYIDWQVEVRSGSVSPFETEEVTLTLGLW